MGSWLTPPAKPRTVDKTRENPPMGRPPGSYGCNQEKLNTLPLAKTRKPHLALTCHSLLHPFHPKNEVQQDPILTEPQRLGSRLSRDHTQLMCMCHFLLQAQ